MTPQEYLLLNALYLAERYHWPLDSIMKMDMKDFLRVFNMTHGKDKALKFVKKNPKMFGMD